MIRAVERDGNGNLEVKHVDDLSTRRAAQTSLPRAKSQHDQYVSQTKILQYDEWHTGIVQCLCGASNDMHACWQRYLTGKKCDGYIFRQNDAERRGLSVRRAIRKVPGNKDDRGHACTRVAPHHDK